MRAHAALLLLCLSSVAWSQNQPDPDLTGYVTRVASSSDFDVNGIHVLCGLNTEMDTPFDANGQSRVLMGCPRAAPYLGLPMDVYGSRREKLRTIEAAKLVPQPEPLGKVSSYGIIQAILARTPQSLDVEADGYRIRITPATALRFEGPVHSLADITPNVWINYKGAQQPDGSIRAVTARLIPDQVNGWAGAERARTNYDPSKVSTPSNHAAEAILGVDPKKIPAWPDAAMEARVSAIGEKLIPACQRSLAASDPIHIDFRFQVTASDPWVDGALSLPSGIILVPHGIVERMQNDSQIAAILADAVAVEIEAQDPRMVAGLRLTGKQYASAALLGSGEMAGTTHGVLLLNSASTEHEMHKMEEQSARVSLSLMHDAGYDITQAPLAWWLLDPRHSKPISEISMPQRAAYFYRILGTTWHGAATP